MYSLHEKKTMLIMWFTHLKVYLHDNQYPIVIKVDTKP